MLMQNTIILYGAQRSGTTLFRHMLDAHKDISCPGAIDFILRFLEKKPASNHWTYDVAALREDWSFQYFDLTIPNTDDGREIVTDFFRQIRERADGILVLIVHHSLDKFIALFPDAKIMHLIRDPRDVAKSCIGMGWAGNTYYAIDEWLKTEGDWSVLQKTFGPGKTIEVSYNDLIADTPAQLERVCAFIGVPFSSDMLDYPERSNYTAPDATAVQRWRKASNAREIALVEIRAKDLLVERHYELSGYPLDPPGLVERAQLWWTNKMGIWKFSIRRYGLWNAVMEKLTRKLAPSLHPLVNQRIYKMWKQTLK